MSLPLAVSASPVGLMHRIAAGSKFDGTLPDSEPYIENGINKYAEGTKGGLFYFQNPRPITITQYHFDFGSPVAYTVAIVSLDKEGAKIPGDSIVVAEGTGAQLQHQHFSLVLGPHQALEVAVSGSPATAMVGTMWAMDATAFFG